MTTAVSPASISPRSPTWASSVALSVVVHGTIVATALFMATLVVRPTALPVIAVDVVFASSGEGATGGAAASGEAESGAAAVDSGTEQPTARPADDPPPVPPPVEVVTDPRALDSVSVADTSSPPPEIELAAAVPPPSIVASPEEADMIEPSAKAIEADPPARAARPPPAAADEAPPVMIAVAPADQSSPDLTIDRPSDSEPPPNPAPDRKAVSDQPPRPETRDEWRPPWIATVVADRRPVELVAKSVSLEPSRDHTAAEPPETLRPPPPERPRAQAVPAPRSKPRRPPPKPRPRQTIPRTASIAGKTLLPAPKPAVSNTAPAGTLAISPVTANPQLAGLTGSSTDKPWAGDEANSMGPAAHTGNRPPEYPARARRRGWQGRVVLRVRVAITGRALSVEVKKSSGYRLLDRAAEEAVRKWRFSPGRLAGVSVVTSADVPIVFRLK